MARLESAKDRIELRNGTGVPCVGFGTWELPEGDAGLGPLPTATGTSTRPRPTEPRPTWAGRCARAASPAKSCS